MSERPDQRSGDNNGSGKQVSVTWKWLAIAMCSVACYFAVTDRQSVDHRITKLEDSFQQMHDAILQLPSRADIRDIIDSRDSKPAEPNRRLP